MWQRKQADSPLDILYTKAQFKGIQPQEMIDYFMDPKTLPMLQECKILEKPSASEQTQYWRMKLPLMSARESTAKVQYINTPKGMFYSANSVNHPDAPHVDGAVQIFYYERGMMSINPEDPSIMEYDSYTILSLGGYVPARLTNYTTSNETSKTLIAAYEYLSKNKK